MPPTIHEVRHLDLAGDFTRFTDGQIQAAIDKAGFWVNETVWDVGSPGRGSCAIALLAAHFIGSAPRVANSTGAGPSGPVTAQAGGGISRSYGSASGSISESSFASSHWGLQFLELKRTIVTTPLILDC